MKKVCKPYKFGSFKTNADFAAAMAADGMDFPISDDLSILSEPITLANGHVIPNRMVIQPLEGFDGTCSATNGEILFRCCQEMITNSMRHSNATKLQILIMKSPTRFSVSIEDNGTGKAGLTPGKGLGGIRSRVLQLGGQVELVLDTEGFRAQLMVPAL